MKPTLLLLSLLILPSIYALLPKELEAKQKPVVYFTNEISPDAVVRMYKLLGIEQNGKLALKVHSGEQGGKYFLTPEFLKKIQEYTKGTFVECNTAYERMRHSTEKHKQLLKDHHWDKAGLVIMDEDPNQDREIEIPEGKVIKKNYVGMHFTDYDSLLVLSHVKGHRMGGFGAALKQLSIGFGSQRGKTYIHTAGNQTDWKHIWEHIAPQQDFTSAMADAALSVVKYFKDKNKGGPAYINVISNVSLGCDCEGDGAPVPKIKDIGILASLDPVAIDMASLNLIKEYADEGEDKKAWFDQLSNLLGTHTIEEAELRGLGSTLYDLKIVNSSFFYKFKLILSLLSFLFLF